MSALKSSHNGTCSIHLTWKVSKSILIYPNLEVRFTTQINLQSPRKLLFMTSDRCCIFITVDTAPNSISVSSFVLPMFKELYNNSSTLDSSSFANWEWQSTLLQLKNSNVKMCSSTQCFIFGCKLFQCLLEVPVG